MMPDQHQFLCEVNPAINGVFPTLRVRTSALNAPVYPATLVDDIPAGEQFQLWGNEHSGMAAWGTAAVLCARGRERFTEASTWLSHMAEAADVHDTVQTPGTGLVAFGSFTFSSASDAPSILIIPRTVVGYGPDGAWRTTITASSVPAPQRRETESCACVPVTPRHQAWDKPVHHALAAIKAGKLRKVVLARAETHLQAQPWDQARLARSLLLNSPTTWTYACAGLIGSTPEMLVQARTGRIFSRVLAGTRATTGADDTAAHHALLASTKDLIEHQFAVDSVVDALTALCQEVRPPSAPFVLGLPHVAHLASDVHATVGPEASALQVVDALQPTAAVCGTPTPTAEEFIATHEPLDRRRYAGAVGWTDAQGNADWGLALRCGQVCEVHPHAITLYAGCGIVAGSMVDTEYEETLAKLQTMSRAMGTPLL